MLIHLLKAVMNKKNLRFTKFALMIIISSFILLQFNSETYAVKKKSIKVVTAVVSNTLPLHSRAIKMLTNYKFIKIAKKRNVKTIIKPRRGRGVELKQPGIIKNVPKKRLRDVEYIIQLDKKNREILCHLIKIGNSRILGAWGGSLKYVVKNCAIRLEAEVALKDLSKLITPPDGIKVKAQFRKKRYGIGEKLEFSVKANANGYLYVVDIQPGGDIILLVPNTIVREFRITKGKRAIIPGDMGFMLKIVPPRGLDTIKAIVTKRPIDIFNCEGLSGGTIKEIQRGKKFKFVRGVAVMVKKLNRGEWGEDSTEIEVVK